MSGAPQAASSPEPRWEDARRLDFELYLSWGWDEADAAFSAYYGKPFRAILILR